MSKFCPNCGSEVGETFNACPNCGTNLGGAMVTNQMQTPTKTNAAAIIGLVFSIIGIGIIGLIVSIVGISQIKKTNEGGKGLAIAGIIISILKIVFFAIMFVATFFFTTKVIKNINNNTLIYQAERVLTRVQESYMADVVLAGEEIPEKCVYYNVSSLGASSDVYEGYAWARFDDEETEYGISIRDNENEIIDYETDDYYYTIELDDIRVASTLKINPPRNCKFIR